MSSAVANASATIGLGEPAAVYLVRAGVVPEVVRCRLAEAIPLGVGHRTASGPGRSDSPDSEYDRGEVVVVRTHRGLVLGDVVARLRSPSPTPRDEPTATVTSPVNTGESRDASPTEDSPAAVEFTIERRATAVDIATAEQLRSQCEQDFLAWQDRIARWGLAIELLDCERTLDNTKQILYVLTDRGPETTKLALQAAAEGLGLIEVQPVSADGLVPLESSGGGCGTGGGCGCHH